MANANAVTFLREGTDEFALAQRMVAVTAAMNWREQPMLLNMTGGYIHQQGSATGSGAYTIYSDSEDGEPAEEYTAGTEPIGENYANRQVNITPDRPIRSTRFISDEQLAQTPIPPAQIFSQKSAEVTRLMGLKADRRLTIRCVQAAESTTDVTSWNGLRLGTRGTVVLRQVGAGGTLNTAYPETPVGASRIRDDLRRMAENLAGKRVGGQWKIGLDYRLYARLTGDNGYVFAGTTTGIAAGPSSLFSRDFGGQNSIHDRRIMMVDGFEVMPMQFRGTSVGGTLPDQTFAFGGTMAKYNGSWNLAASTATRGQPVAIALAPGAEGVGAVSYGSWSGLRVQLFRDDYRPGFRVDGYMQMGTGIVNTECAGVIEITTNGTDGSVTIQGA